ARVVRAASRVLAPRRNRHAPPLLASRRGRSSARPGGSRSSEAVAGCLGSEPGPPRRASEHVIPEQISPLCARGSPREVAVGRVEARAGRLVPATRVGSVSVLARGARKPRPGRGAFLRDGPDPPRRAPAKTPSIQRVTAPRETVGRT